MIFLDNSSSSFYKPPCVVEAVKNTLQFLPFNASRASHSGAIKASQLIYDTRKKTADAFGCNPERVVFCGGCTEALNLAIFGSVKSGGHIISTPFEHNAVLRPLYHLCKANGVRVSFATSANEAQSMITSKTYMIITNHVSNVTGAQVDLEAYGELARRFHLLFLVDAAQSAGYHQIDMKKTGIDMLAIAPHKGLHAMQGVGCLLLSERVLLKPFKYGGTGTLSSSNIQPTDIPEGLESGTLPTPAIASVNAGLEWSMKRLQENAQKLKTLSYKMIESLQKIERLSIYSRPNDCGIVAFNIDGLTSQEAGDIYNEQYDIALRCGFHCAPLLHKFYKTTDGMIRASLGVESTTDDVDFFIDATKEIADK